MVSTFQILEMKFDWLQLFCHIFEFTFYHRRQHAHKCTLYPICLQLPITHFMTLRTPFETLITHPDILWFFIDLRDNMQLCTKESLFWDQTITNCRYIFSFKHFSVLGNGNQIPVRIKVDSHSENICYSA